MINDDKNARPSLQSLFSEQRVEFHNRLTETHTLPELAECVEELLVSLQDRFLGVLPVRAARFAKRCFTWLRVSPAVLKAAARSEYSVESDARSAGSAVPLPKSHLIATLLQVAIGLVALMAIVHISLTGTVLLCFLLFLLGLEMFGILMSVWKGRKTPPILWTVLGLPAPEQQDEAAEKVNVKATLLVDAAKVCDALMEAFVGIDRAIADQEESNTKTEEKTLTDYPHALELLQKLVSVATMGDAARALNLASETRAVLLAYQIKTHVYDAARNSEWFDAEPAVTPNIRAHTTDLVALTSGNNLLRRGRVIEPHKSEA